MLNKLKNVHSSRPDAIPVYLAPKGNQADISLGAMFLESEQQPERFKGCFKVSL